MEKENLEFNQSSQKNQSSEALSRRISIAYDNFINSFTEGSKNVNAAFNELIQTVRQLERYIGEEKFIVNDKKNIDYDPSLELLNPNTSYMDKYPDWTQAAETNSTVKTANPDESVHRSR